MKNSLTLSLIAALFLGSSCNSAEEENKPQTSAAKQIAQIPEQQPIQIKQVINQQQVRLITPQQQAKLLSAQALNLDHPQGHPQGPAECAPAPAADINTVQLALLLDTSNSMDGLINQAKTQLWSIVNELASAKRNGENIKLQIALYEYGNSELKDPQFVRMVLPFTSDLDAISRELFALKTRGGDEYCATAIQRSLAELKWAAIDNAKIVFVCGNEPFNQGPTKFQQTCPAAFERGVVINTIFCGNKNQGVNGHWASGAQLGGGLYANIDGDAGYVDIPTPYDDKLRKANMRLNGTYIHYGARGLQMKLQQSEEDSNAERLSIQSLSGRAKSKSSSLYSNSSWDLVDADKKQNFDYSKLKKEQLPKALQGKSTKEIQAYVATQKAARALARKEIMTLNAEREKFRQKKLQEMQKGEGKLLENELLNALHLQCGKKGISWKKK